MIVLKNVDKNYKSQKGLEFPALRDVSVEFGKKGLIFILGKSGSGKTTLLNLIGGIDQPTRGEIIFKGKSFKDFSQNEYDTYRNDCVGFVFQEYNLLSGYSVGQNISLASELKGESADRRKIEDILRQMGLFYGENTFFDRKVNELSGGEKQRVAIARALVKNPDIILADEPSGALDSKTGNDIYEILKKISKDRLVVVVSHDEASARKFADRIIQIDGGKITDDTGTLNEEPSDKASEFKPIKKKLLFKRVFTMGAKSLKYNKPRLAISIFLSVFMCLIFGFALCGATCDLWSTQLKMLYDNDVSYAILQSGSYRRLIYPNGKHYKSYGLSLTALQKQGVEERFGIAPLVMVRGLEYRGKGDYVDVREHVAVKDNNTAETYMENNAYVSMIFRNFDAVMEVNPKVAEYVGLTPDSRLRNPGACRLPKDFNEIAISDAKADLFMRYGYIDADGIFYSIKTPDDLIGKKLGYLTICGVYSTCEDRAALQKKYDRNEHWSDRADIYADFLSGTHIMNFSFVLDGFASNLYGSSVIEETSDALGAGYFVKLSGNRFADRLFFNNEKITYDEDICHYTLRIVSPYSKMAEYAAGFLTNEDFLAVMWAIGFVFAFIGVLTFMNYQNTNIELRKRELGILRALGATRKDIVSICLVESFIVAAIVFIISTIGTAICCHFANKWFCNVPLYIVGVIPALSLLLICVGSALLATIPSVRRVAKRKPVDIINDKT